jgi:hypothetical protein
MRIPSAWVALVAVVPVALVLGGCDKTIDTDDLQKTIQESVQSTSDVKVKSVSCPDDIKAEKGKKFDCTVTPTSGSPVKITVTLIDNDGKFTYAAATTTPAPASTTTTEQPATPDAGATTAP